METTKLTNVDEVDDPLNNPGPVDPGIARLIRDEVQAAVRGVHETFSAPPSYSPSAPLLGSTPADDDVDTEANQPTSPPPPPQGPVTLWDWCKFVITMGAMVTWMIGWGVLIGTGVDPLAFSMLACFLVLALIYFILMCACIQVCIVGKPKKVDPVPLTPETKRQRVNLIMAVSIAFLGMWIMFIGIIWGWAVIVLETPPGVWHVYKVWRDVQSKIDAPHALWSLAQCLQQAIPERNATIVDISTCLKAMGMKESFVPTVVV
ncbi:uncharacterized protein PAC_02371 [Phialocephala subalpina]|uniref:Uncharacterized protein n=1 Tax=Phialocephala subalpina TaxID=576137 RepID=A0A1L7WI92_9HELO|nr:uncharacterized protein PAC_02371 [Phialocephala subalpina]